MTKAHNKMIKLKLKLKWIYKNKSQFKLFHMVIKNKIMLQETYSLLQTFLKVFTDWKETLT